MTFCSFRGKFFSLLACLWLSACGGSGSPANPPTDLQVQAGDGQVTLTWTAEPGVDYWLAYATGSSVSTRSDSPHIWARNAAGSTNVSSPFVLSGLSNGVTYSFSLNGRKDGGAGGAGTPAISATPRLAGKSWNRADPGWGSHTLRAIAFGTSSDATQNYLAVGDAGSLYRSADGVTATPITFTDSSVNFQAAGYAFGKYLALADAGRIYTSPDLITWTAASVSASTNKFNSVATNGSLAVAVGDAGTIRYSNDASTWNAAAVVPTSQHLYGVTYNYTGSWIAVGANATVLTSSDGSNWSPAASLTPASTADLRSVVAQFKLASNSYVSVAVGTAGTVLTSTDSSNWTSQTLSDTLGAALPNLTAVVSNANQFLAVGDAAAVLISADGTNWSVQNTCSTIGGACVTPNLLGLVNAQAQYVAVGQTASVLYSR